MIITIFMVYYYYTLKSDNWDRKIIIYVQGVTTRIKIISV